MTQQQLVIPTKKATCTLYDIIIPESVENKIRYLCSQISQVEWSGVLFYSVEGNFEDADNPLKVTCKDIFLQDIGTGTATEFDMSADVMAYAIENDLTDYYMGLIHSHNSMPTFFSGTDIATLQQEGENTNHFVSLIVNNVGKYTAAITRLVTVTKVLKKISYKSFGDEEKNSVEEITNESKYIEYFELNIKKEVQEFSFEDIDALIADIKKKKEEENKKKIYTPPYTPPSYNWKEQSLFEKPKTEQKVIQDYTKPLPKPVADTVPTHASYEKTEIEDDEDYEPEIVNPDDLIFISDEEVEDAIKQLVSCSPVLPSLEKFDLDKWKVHFPKLCKNRFLDDIPAFTDYIRALIENILFYYTNDYLAGIYTEDTIQAMYADRILEELQSWANANNLSTNIYIKAILEVLEEFILTY